RWSLSPSPHPPAAFRIVRRKAPLMPASKHALSSRVTADLSFGRDNLIRLLEALLEPIVLGCTLWGISIWHEGEIAPAYFILSVLVFALLFPGKARMQETLWHSSLDILLSFAAITALLLLLGYATGLHDLFPPAVIAVWLWLAPLALLAGNLIFRRLLPLLAHMQGGRRRAIIVGLNQQGAELAQRIEGSPYDNIELLGFFDDRTEERTAAAPIPVQGKPGDIA